MAKRPARKSKKSKGSTAKRSAKRPAKKARKSAPKRTMKQPVKRKPAKRSKKTTPKGTRKVARLNRARRTLDESVPTPPSSLNMNRKGSAARTGRAETAQHLQEHASLTPDIAGGDVDVNVEDAYFTGDEAPGGDNQTPDQDVVDDIGKALGVQYDDAEELKGSDKVVERDKHRWELDPASAEDYKERK